MRLPKKVMASEKGVGDADGALIRQHRQLPIRARDDLPPHHSMKLDLNSGCDRNSLLLSVHPPRSPDYELQHVPCDIVLVIDVSGSMHYAAPLPDAQDAHSQESTGLSVLDLTRHAALTVVETMNEGDRLGLVVFGTDAKIVMSLTAMNETNKSTVIRSITELQASGGTNLWAGIRTGLELFQTADFEGHAQGLYVLTDGQPNCMCPRQGYVNKLRPLLEAMSSQHAAVPTIHTFGFGYDIRSGLLQSIAEVGRGSYAFIPDAGMIGTVFVHAVANLYTTYAVEVSVTLQAPHARSITVPAGLPVIQHGTDVVLSLGNVQYGQSKDVLIEFTPCKAQGVVSANLTYRTLDGTINSVEAKLPANATSQIPTPTLRYHVFRAQLCRLLNDLFVVDAQGEHQAVAKPVQALVRAKLAALAGKIRASSCSDDPNVQSLLADLDGQDPHGQIGQAMTDTPTKPYWDKWGRHYLPSLLHAHMRQECISFKDPGPLRYGVNSPLFIQCRDELDAAFENLEAPKPSLRATDRYGNLTQTRVNMARYHASDGSCFLGSCRIAMADGIHQPVSSLRAGDWVWNSLLGEKRQVSAVLKSVPTRSWPTTRPDRICRIGRLWITPFHPFLCQERRAPCWEHPVYHAQEDRALHDREAVYSIMLADDPRPDAHVVYIEGQTAVTLGHGMVDLQAAGADVRAHSFFGCREALWRELDKLPLEAGTGHRVCGGVERDLQTKRIVGFLSPAHAAQGQLDARL